MIWRLIPSWLKLVLAAIVAAIFIGGFAYQVGKYSVWQRGVVLQLKDDLKIERKRSKDDAKARNFSDYDFCMHALHSRGVRSREECEQLRWLEAE
ncbi:hypothetical protein [Paenochrobactrum pullorum]|uniref:hypothetical protein n=1 Tax=Paenochrobactrum pullorum TaxID=1324351 RepID=UPI0035BBB86D